MEECVSGRKFIPSSYQAMGLFFPNAQNFLPLPRHWQYLYLATKIPCQVIAL